MAGRTRAHAHALIADGHVDQRLLVVMVASTAVGVVVLALELVLDALPIRGVPDQWENWPDPLDKERTLTGLSIVERGLRHSRSANPAKVTKRRDGDGRTCTQ